MQDCRENEAQCLATSGLGDTDEIVPLEDNRPGLSLDRCWDVNPVLIQAVIDTLGPTGLLQVDDRLMNEDLLVMFVDHTDVVLLVVFLDFILVTLVDNGLHVVEVLLDRGECISVPVRVININVKPEEIEPLSVGLIPVGLGGLSGVPSLLVVCRDLDLRFIEIAFGFAGFSLLILLIALLISLHRHVLELRIRSDSDAAREWVSRIFLRSTSGLLRLRAVTRLMAGFATVVAFAIFFAAFWAHACALALWFAIATIESSASVAAGSAVTIAAASTNASTIAAASAFLWAIPGFMSFFTAIVASPLSSSEPTLAL